MHKTLHWSAPIERRHHRGRLAAAWALRRASTALARIARRLGRAEAAGDPPEPMIEFYAESGAPEGALFVNGVRVGSLPGVTRL